MANVGRQISHACGTDIDSSADHHVTLFNIVREYGCNVKRPQLLTEIIQGVYNFFFPRNLFIRNLLSESQQHGLPLLRERDRRKLNRMDSTWVSTYQSE
jgi:hypothetical protein